MPLTPPTGPYPVSTLTLELPLPSPRSFYPDAYRFNPSSPSSTPAFRLRTVLFTLFYPTDIPQASDSASSSSLSNLTKGTFAWLTSPKLKSIEGILKYAGVSKYFALPAILPAYQVLLAKLPYYQGAPLARTPGNRKWPTAVFSHGLGGTSVTYSSYLASLASHGVVITAVEHRDGSSPATSVRTRSDDGNGKINEESILYFKYDEVRVHPVDPSLGESAKEEAQWEFRRAQLEIRRAELREAIRVLSDMNSGQGAAVSASSTREGVEVTQADLPTWQGQLHMDEGVLLLGHSFGGATVLSDQLGSDSSSQRVSKSIKAKLAILLDPWLEPLQLSPDSVTSATGARPPIFTINSQGFTLWKTHFDRLKALLSSYASSSFQNDKGDSSQSATLVTLTGTRHTDFSDFPFLIPRLFASDVDPLTANMVFSEVSRRVIFNESMWGKDGEAEGVLDLGDGKEVQWRWEKEEELQQGSKDMGKPVVLVRHDLHPNSTKVQQ